MFCVVVPVALLPFRVVICACFCK